jgi:hypothetical protein
VLDQPRRRVYLVFGVAKGVAAAAAEIGAVRSAASRQAALPPPNS